MKYEQFHSENICAYLSINIYIDMICMNLGEAGFCCLFPIFICFDRWLASDGSIPSPGYKIILLVKKYKNY